MDGAKNKKSTSTGFQYDVFLSHSAKDKAVVRPLAERLRQDGLKVTRRRQKASSGMSPDVAAYKNCNFLTDPTSVDQISSTR